MRDELEDMSINILAYEEVNYPRGEAKGEKTQLTPVISNRLLVVAFIAYDGETNRTLSLGKGFDQFLRSTDYPKHDVMLGSWWTGWQ